MQHANLSAAVAALAIVLTACPTMAADKALLDILLDNGAITQAQYERLLERDEITAADLAEPGGDAEEPEGGAAQISIDSGGFEVRSENGEFAIRIGGRLHADYAAHSGGGNLPVAPTDGTEIRRARIEIGGTFHRDWRWAAQADFADNDVGVKDFSLSYRGFEKLDLTFGHQKQPYSLAVEMSSNDLPFLERSIDNDLIIPFVDRAVGIRADADGARWYAAAGLYGESVSPGSSGDEGWGIAGRYVFAPILEDDRVLHVGIRAARRYVAETNPVARIRDETTHFSSLRIVDTGILPDVDAVTLLGPEAAYVQGRLSLTGEYNDASIDRMAAADLDFASWHVAATWSLGPESRADAYRIGAGEFKGLAPMENFRRGEGGGAWEIAARYASIDLNDGAFVGGSEKTFSFGGNWYVNPNVRMLFHWTRIVDTDGSNAVRSAADGLDVIGIRAQYTF